MENNILIKRGQEEDTDKILKIEIVSFQNPWSKESIVEDISNKDRSYYYLISESDEIVGYISIWLILDEISINNIAISKQYRGKGYGKLLIEKIFELGKEKEVRNYILEVRESNVEAIGLYEKVGFKIIGKRKQFYSNGETALIMSKYIG